MQRWKEEWMEGRHDDWNNEREKSETSGVNANAG
jgi:hypothetical protein